MIDIEGSQSIWKDNDLGRELNLITLTIVCSTLILIIAQNFNMIKVTIFLFIEVIFTLYFICYTREANGFSKHIFNICSLAFGFGVYLYIQLHWVDRFQSLITSSIDSQSLFQSIFDNSDESIIIVTDEKAETINRTLLNEFE
jgi:hypothetical protein